MRNARTCNRVERQADRLRPRATVEYLAFSEDPTEEDPTEVDQKVELSRNLVAAPADKRGFPAHRPNRGYRQRKTAPQNGAVIAIWSGK